MLGITRADLRLPGANATIEPAAAQSPPKVRLRLIHVVSWAVAAVCATGFVIALRQPTASPQLVRFSVYPPDGTWFGGTPSVSPDGGYLMSHLVRRNEPSVMWVRPLDATSGQMLTGTEGARGSVVRRLATDHV